MIYDKLTPKDKELITNYIQKFAATDCDCSDDEINLPRVLKSWSENKIDLYKLLGEEFIIRKQISYTKDISNLNNDLYHNDIVKNFIYEFKDRYFRLTQYDRDYDIICYSILDWNTLATNKIDVDYVFVHPESGEEIKVQKGMKATKVIKKLLPWVEISENEYEKFRLEHSKVLNDKAMNGTLCLSIHPMDYITMSDNKSNWSSCMSWVNEGGYRGGTVECMNSTNTLVAYLENEDDPCSFISDSDWNNKKWRCLFVVNPDVITSVKSYPYHNDDILDIVIKWLAELAKENWGAEFDTNTIATTPSGIIDLNTEFNKDLDRRPYMYFVTNGIMYNDFGCASNHHYVLSNDFKAHEAEITEDIAVHYTEEMRCMYCGEVFYPEYESLVLCDNCYNPARCDNCGCVVDASDSYYGPDGERLCECCYDDICCYDEIRNTTIYNEESIEIYIKEIPNWVFVTSDVILYDPTYFSKTPEQITDGYSYYYETSALNITPEFYQYIDSSFAEQLNDVLKELESQDTKETD